MKLLVTSQQNDSPQATYGPLPAFSKWIYIESELWLFLYIPLTSTSLLQQPNWAGSNRDRMVYKSLKYLLADSSQEQFPTLVYMYWRWPQRTEDETVRVFMKNPNNWNPRPNHTHRSLRLARERGWGNASHLSTHEGRQQVRKWHSCHHIKSRLSNRSGLEAHA